MWVGNKKSQPIITELFITSNKLNICLAVITQSGFAVPKNSRLNSTHSFIMKVLNKSEFQQIAVNHAWDIDFKEFRNLIESYSYLVNDTRLASDNALRFRLII